MLAITHNVSALVVELLKALKCASPRRRYAFPIKCTEVILGDDNETVREIRAEYDPSKKTKPKVSCKLIMTNVIS